MYFVVFGVVLALLLCPDISWAWGPATHLYYGFNLLDHLANVSQAFQGVLASEPRAFLYGCVGADIVLAKKWGTAASHGHRWDNALRLHDLAQTPRTQAFSLGYLCHMAADTVSHNCYVPSKTVESYRSGILKHVYWEMRFDEKLTSTETLKAFKDIVDNDFSDCDAHMEKLIPVRLFNFTTNKKVFNRLLVLQGFRRWQDMLHGMALSKEHKLSNEEVDYFVEQSFAAVLDFFKNGTTSKICTHDPIGQARLKQANALRRYYWIQKLAHSDDVVGLALQASYDFKLDADQPLKIEDYKLKV